MLVGGGREEERAQGGQAVGVTNRKWGFNKQSPERAVCQSKHCTHTHTQQNVAFSFTVGVRDSFGASPRNQTSENWEREREGGGGGEMGVGERGFACFYQE